MSTKQSPGPSRAERLTSLIYALATTERQWNAERIGNYLNPTGNPDAREKAIERAKDEIRNEFGLRLVRDEVDSVAYYRIDTTDWYLPPIKFSAAETALIALAASLWKDSKLQALALNATARITGADPAAQSIAPFVGAYLPRLSMDEPNFKTCALAVFNQKTVQFSYRDATGNETKRLVDMWGIGQRYGNWYFTGWDHTREATRVFRLSRVTGNFGITRTPNGAKGYHPRPEGFSMSQVLRDFDLQHPAHLATVQVLDEAATPLRVRALNADGSQQGVLKLAYADPEAFAAELAGYGPHLVVQGPESLAQAVCGLLVAALDAHRQRPESLTGGNIKYQPHRAAGRGSTAQQVMRNIDMIQYVVAHGGASVGELSKRYSLSPAQLRQELAMIMMCGVPGGQHDELINVNDGDLDSDNVSITNAALLAEPQKLAPMEAVAILGGLNALASIPDFEHRQILDSALGKINEAVARFDGWNGALGFALSQVQDDDAIAVLAAAVRQHQVVCIDYYSAHSQTHQTRQVEPIRIFEDGSRMYLRAYCRTREGILTFRVDRILDVKLTGEDFTLGPRHQDSDQIQLSYTASDDDLEVELFIEPELVPVIEAYNPVSWSQAKVAGGHLVKVRFSDHMVVAPLVARHGGKIVVVSPPATRTYVESWLQSALHKYEDGS